MFYEKQPQENRDNYKRMLGILGKLSKLFSESDKPYLYYRCHENIFCKYFDVTNLSREDCSADAKKDEIGIGLKTWIDADNQKVAEFNKLKTTYEKLNSYDMVCKIAEYRNERIRITKNLHGIKEMIYHIVKRIPNAMNIYECAFDTIDIQNIVLDDRRTTQTNIYFTDGRHNYHFNTSKSTLYMIFEDMDLLDTFEVDILEDPFSYLECLAEEEVTVSEELSSVIIEEEKVEQLCLRLYTVNKRTKEKTVEEHSGLNQWNGARRNSKTGKLTPRNENELYIPYPAYDRDRSKGFFPPRNKSFELVLPDGQVIQAKVCQSHGKAIMSNPNSELGRWLLRDVFELPVGTLVTYDMLKVYGIDSVIFTKLGECKYKINFTELGTYEKLLGLEDGLDEE